MQHTPTCCPRPHTLTAGVGRERFLPVERSTRRTQWDEVLQRARLDSLPVANLRVRLFDDGNFHHGAQFCGQNTRQVELDAKDAVATTVPGWCECGGWLGTRFGALLQAVHEQYRAIEDETSELRHTEWNDAWHAFSSLSDRQSWVYRTDDLELEHLRHRTRLATLAVLERSRAALPVADLERRIGAQGLRVPIQPGDGAFLQRWAHDLRIDPRPQPHRRAVRAARRCEYDDLLDTALADAHARNDRVLVVVLAGTNQELPLDTGLPAELALLLWALGLTTTGTQVLHLLRPIAEGIAAISSQHQRIGVAQSDETDTETLEALRTLCEDARSSKSDGFDLDGLLTTSRML